MGQKKEEEKLKQQQAQAQQQQAAQAQQAQQATAASAAPTKDVSAEIKKLSDLHNSGALTDQEFAESKKKLLGI